LILLSWPIRRQASVADHPALWLTTAAGFGTMRRNRAGTAAG